MRVCVLESDNSGQSALAVIYELRNRILVP
jgi:hypothetical protein